jgi:ATP-dependent metalloprotease
LFLQSAQRRPLPRTFSSTTPAFLPPRYTTPSSSPSSPSSPFSRLAPAFLPSSPLLRTYASASTTPTKTASPLSDLPSSVADSLEDSLEAIIEAAEADPSDIELRRTLIEKFESTTAFWLADSTVQKKTGALDVVKKDETAFQAYLKALASVAGAGEDSFQTAELFEKLQTARGRRAELLKLEPILPPPADAAAKPSTPAFSPPALISSLFGGSSGRGKGGEAKIQSVGSFGSWANSSGKAGEGEPIRVIVEEAKSPLAWRVLKFVATTALYSFLLCVFLSPFPSFHFSYSPFSSTASPSSPF